MELTEKDWKTVDSIAQTLAGQGVDRNELGKAMSYLRQTRDKAKFLDLLTRLPDSDYIRSKRTKNYFKNIHRTLEYHLHSLDDARALAVVGWAFRMMTYQKFESEKWYSSKRRRK